MRASRDTRLGALIAGVLVAIVWWVAVVIDRHAIEHGHCPPLAMIDVELAQRRESEVGRELAGVCHDPMVEAPGLGKHVRGGRP